MRNQRGIGAFGALGALAGVAGAVGGGIALYNLSKTVDRIPEIIDQRAGEAIRAVPGERLLQMYDGLFGADDAKRKEVKDVLTKMLGTDLSKEYEASASFRFDSTKNELQAQIFPATTSNVAEVKLYFAPSSNENLQAVKGVVTRGWTTEEMRAAIGERLEAASIGKFTPDEVKLVNSGAGPLDFGSFEYADQIYKGTYRIGALPGMFGGVYDGSKDPKVLSALSRYKVVVRNRWADAVLQLVEDRSVPLPSGVSSVPWRPATGHRTLFVAVRGDQLDAHRGDPCVKPDGRGCVDLWVHEVGRPDLLFRGSQNVAVSIEEFYQNEPVPHPYLKGVSLRWAARVMDPTNTVDARSFEELLARQKTAKNFEDSRN